MHAIEFHGRLCRSDGRPANPGAYDLCFALHASRDDTAAVWEETQRDIPVAPGGFYHTILGVHRPLTTAEFDGSTRFLSVRVVRAGRPGEEDAERVPLLGVSVRLGAALDALEGQASQAPDRPRREGPSLVGRRLRILKRRLQRLEGGGGALAPVLGRLAQVEARLDRIDGAEGRMAHFEDELEDLVGPDGDVVDLTERMDELERGDEFEGRAEPGEVVVTLGGRKVARSDRAGDPRVVGVVTGVRGEHLSVATRGVVTCRVEGPIRLGDLLSTGGKPGRARAVHDGDLARGAVLGKALGELASGVGEVSVLVLLR